MSGTIEYHIESHRSGKRSYRGCRFDSKYGARPLRRAIQTRIEDEMATEILEGRIKAGDTVQVKVKDKKSVLYPRNHRSKKPFFEKYKIFSLPMAKRKEISYN